MATRHAAGIDVGTYHIKVVIVEEDIKSPHHPPRIIGTGYAESRGLRYGYIINSDDVTESLKRALRMAEKTAGFPVKHAYVGLGGVSLDSVTATGSTIISRGDNEVTDYDVDQALSSSESAIPEPEIVNKKILHTIPQTYKLDDRRVLGRPIGMKGVKLEASTLFVTCLEQHLHDLVQAVEDAGVSVQDVVASPLAASVVSLTKAQKIAGCVLTNIGSETVSIVVFENNIPISLAVFPIGSTDITNDIALGLKVPLEEAEQLKLGGITSTNISKKKLDEIVTARVTDIFEIIQSHLKKLGKNEILPAGIILTGGGSGIATIDDLARGILNLPSKVADVSLASGERLPIKDASWAVAYGLGIIGLSENVESIGIDYGPKSGNKLVEWIKNFLP